MSALRSAVLRSSRAVPSSSRIIAPLRPQLQLSLRQQQPCLDQAFRLARRWNSSATAPESPQIEAPTGEQGKQSIGKIEPRLQMTFTCTANDCGHRSTHEFSKNSYQKGIVLVQCPECKARHLIADHLGWFKESMEDGKLKTVEDLLRAKGEKIKKGRVNFDGDIEIEGEP
ncbi:hypothetical protein IAT38_003978 [Cryptococcus sp. DSM 104549]